MNSPHTGPRNRLLAALPSVDLSLLQPLLELVDIEARQVLEMPGKAITHVHFVESGLVSVVGTCLLYTSPSPRD